MYWEGQGYASMYRLGEGYASWYGVGEGYASMHWVGEGYASSCWVWEGYPSMYMSMSLHCKIHTAVFLNVRSTALLVFMIWLSAKVAHWADEFSTDTLGEMLSII